MGRSTMDGVSDGEWSVFAEKIVEERDALRAEVERLLRAKLADAKEAGKQLAEVTAIVRTARLAGSTSTNGESQQKESDVRDDELKAMVQARAMFEHCLAVVRAHDSSLTRR